MSIDEIMDAAHAYSFKYHCYRVLGKKAPMEKWEAVRDSVDALRAAIEQHVAEAVAREREELLDLVDSYAKDNADLKDAIRARAGKETK